MTASNDRLIGLLKSYGIDRDVLSSHEADWATPDDLDRLSVEAMARKQLGTERFLDSHGLIHLHGEGVEGHSANLDAVGGVMLYFQRLVTAVGCFLKGDTSLRGRIPMGVVERTKMKLSAQPQPGSIVLLIEPRVRGMEEAFPKGKTLFGYDCPEKPLADESAARLAGVLSMVEDDDLTPFLADMEKMGPRVASSMREFLKEMSADEFDTDVEWHEPGQATLRANVSNQRAQLAYRAIECHDLDTTVETLEGTLYTITLSSSKKLELTTTVNGEECTIPIRRGELSNEVLSEFSVTEPVRIKVKITRESRPGGEVGLRYEAISIERLISDEDAIL